MSCQELFASVAKDPKKAEKIDAKSPGCACEEYSVSPHSPGPVTDDETLWRLILSPVHYDVATGKVTEAAFDDASNKGMSVQRLLVTGSEGDIRQRGYSRAAAKPGRTFECAIGATAAGIRALCSLEDGGRFCIYDTADAADPGHADVCQTRHGSRRARAQLRRELQKQFSLLIHPERSP